MSQLLARLRELLQRVFFWHGGSKHSTEFTPEPAHDHALVLQVTSTPPVPRWRQLRYVARVLSIHEQRTLIILALVFVLAVTFAGVVLMQSRIVTVPAGGGRVVEAVVGAPKYPHPFYAATNDPDQDLVSLIYAGLFRRTDGSNVVPDLVERFEWSTDGKILTATLRENARFHDGAPVTSDDVIFTLETAKDAAWKSAYVNLMRGMTLERVDDRTVKVILERPDVGILDTLTVGILPAHIWQDVPPGSAHLADANIRPIGAGPFRVRSFLRDGRGAILAYTLERNNRYHGLKSYVEQIELRYFADHQLAEEALMNGQVDSLAFIPGPKTNELTKHERLTASLLELPQETIAFLNVNDPTLKDIKVRQALSVVIERDEIVEAQAGMASPVGGPFPFLAFDAATSTPEERLDQGRKLLEEAGWVKPINSDLRIKKVGSGRSTSTQQLISTPSSTVFSLTLTVPDVPDLVAVAEVLKRRWSLIGAQVDIKVDDASALARKVLTDRTAQILVWNVLLSPSQDPYPVWWSGETKGRGLNLSNLADRNVDDAIEALRAATTTERLNESRVALTKQILARTPAVFLTRPSYGYIHNARLHGMSPVLQLGRPSDRFNDVANWYVNKGWRWR